MFLTISRRQVIAVANSVVLTYFDQIQFLKATKFIFQTHRHWTFTFITSSRIIFCVLRMFYDAC